MLAAKNFASSLGIPEWVMLLRYLSLEYNSPPGQYLMPSRVCSGVANSKTGCARKCVASPLARLIWFYFEVMSLRKLPLWLVPSECSLYAPDSCPQRNPDGWRFSKLYNFNPMRSCCPWVKATTSSYPDMPDMLSSASHGSRGSCKVLLCPRHPCQVSPRPWEYSGFPGWSVGGHSRCS